MLHIKPYLLRLPILVILAASNAARAQIPQGSELLVNTTITGNQGPSRVASLDQGGFVVIWTNFTANPPDTDDYNISGQRFDSTGAKLGNEFLINTYTTDFQSQVDVASQSDGDFVVAFRSYAQNSPYASIIFAERFSSSGNRISEALQVSPSASYQFNPAVSYRENGDFVVVWESLTPTDGSNYGIRARYFTSAGVSNWGPLYLNQYTTGAQRRPAVSFLGDSGDFAVVWSSSESNLSDTDNNSIIGGLFNASATPVAPQFQVNQFTPSNQDYPHLDARSDGSFIVTWQSFAFDGDSFAILGRRFQSNGSAIDTSDFLVNEVTLGQQIRARVSAAPDDGFLIAWDTLISGDFAIKARAFSSTGSALGTEFQVNGTQLSPDSQRRSALAHTDAAGSFVVTWDGSVRTPVPFDDVGIGAQRFGSFPTTTFTVTATRTITPTNTQPPSPTSTNTRTITPTATASPSQTPTASGTRTPTSAIPPSQSPTASGTRTPTSAIPPSQSPTASPTAPPGSTSTRTPSPTGTGIPPQTSTATPTTSVTELPAAPETRVAWLAALVLAGIAVGRRRRGIATKQREPV